MDEEEEIASISTLAMATGNPAASVAPTVLPSLPVKSGGRPKNSTNKAKQKRQDDEKAAATWAAPQFQQKKIEAKTSSGRVANGTLKSIIKQATAKFNVKPESVNPEAVRTRVKRERSSHDGAIKSPLHDMEEMLVKLCAVKNEAGNL